ncbi:uncharacterized protein LOC114942316 [Nylanderia fulva]|uniref:uncharacterized protein LOC114942316 n=1 Tax=Nylanderia fulva TaxID=613905 RepID=UPI0010FBAE4A|nr:uncharacterized protein LOC114942316 [Nylanderia fulva]
MESKLHNEILFYSTYARPDENLARCYYVHEQACDSVIALENVNARGYYHCPFTYDPPLEYVITAMREIARFHGKGYVMKELQREKFFNIANQLRETKFPIDMVQERKNFLKTIVMRTVNYLRSNNYEKEFCDKMAALISNTYGNMTKILETVEPLSTTCHGDYVLTNLLFKKEDDGQLRGIPIDFAEWKYARPVVDLSTFLCVSCSTEMRRYKFFEFIRVYHNELKKYLSDAGIWNAEKYSYDVFLDDFKRGAFFGLIIASYFLPVLWGYSKLDIEMLATKGYMESAKECSQAGGDKMSKIITDVLLHLRDLGCLENVS